MTTLIVRRTPRFLDRLHAGELSADRIDDFIEAWHGGELSGPDRFVELHVFLGLAWPEYADWGRTGELPTAAAHALVCWDAIQMQVDGQKMMIGVHPPTRCRPTCPAHWPSEHPLARAPKWWDPLAGIMMRTCSHGADHPDPDDQQVRLHPELAEHRCDGCCRAVVIEGDHLEVSPSQPQIGGAA